MEMQETKLKPQQTRSSAKGAITNTAKALVILITTMAIFYQDLTALFTNALKDQAATYLLLIPILFAYLVYRKRKMLKASIPQQSSKLFGYIPINILMGILLLLLSFLLYWYGSYTSASSQYHILSLPIFLAGSLLFLFNAATMRQLLFSTVYFTLLTPSPLETLQINSASVGISSVIGFTAIAIFTAYLVRDRIWKKAVIFLTSLTIITLFISFYQSTDLAPSLALTVGIWTLTILGTLIILEAFAKLLKTRIFTAKNEKCTSCNTKRSTNDVCPACSRILAFSFNPKKGDIVKIVTLSLAVILILYAQASVLALARAHPEITIPSERTSISTAILPQLTNYTLKFMYRDQSVEQKSKQDASLLYAYYPTNKTRQIIWVAIEIASSIKNLPTWEPRLNTSFRSRVTIIEQTDIQVSQITCHYLSFNYSATNTLQAVLYWYDTSILKFNSTSQQKQAEISLVAYPQNISQLSTTNNQLLAAANSVVNYWQPAKIWSQVSLIMSQNGDKLVIVAFSVSVLVFICPLILTRRGKQRNTIAYQKLSKENLQTVKSVYDAEKTSISTLTNISANYAKITGKPIARAEMLEKLSQIEKTGLIQRTVGNRDDEPTQAWKTMCFCE